jgi:predicted aldo/keto reductase-like oxidoreductase
MDRRSLFRGVGAACVAAAASRRALAQSQPQTDAVPPLPNDAAVPDEARDYIHDAAASLPKLTDPGERRGDMLYRKFGATGETVSAIGLGGAHIGRVQSDAEAIRLMHEAIDRGITYMDNSWDYNGGVSEQRMGQALAQNGYRNKVFLMTKVDGRDTAAATRQLDQSLRRLRTDHVDLWQFHEIIRFEDPNRIFAANGALKVAMDARKAGKIRFIGFTGHKDPHIHLYMLQIAAQHGFHFDAVLFPSNVMDAHYRSFAHEVMPYAMRENLAIQTMKPFGGRYSIFAKANTGLQPIDYLHYALNLPTSVVITGIDSQHVLDQAFEAARTFRPMDVTAVAALLGKTQQAGSNGYYELFKTTSHYDSTAHHPEWLGGPSSDVSQLL